MASTFTIVLVLLLQWNTICAVSFSKGTPRSFSPTDMRQLIRAMHSVIAAKVAGPARISPGASFRDIVTVTGTTLRVYVEMRFFNRDMLRQLDPGSCSTMPQAGSAQSDMTTRALRNMFSNVLHSATGMLMADRCDFCTIVHEEYSVEYIWLRPADELLHPALATNLTNATPVPGATSQALLKPKWNDRDCFPRFTSLLPGNVKLEESVIGPGQLMFSPNQLYKVVMQPDCNLVMYYNNNNVDNIAAAIWKTDTDGLGDGCYAVMQLDCNFVVYSPTRTEHPAVWASESMACKGCVRSCSLTLQSDRNLVVYSEDLEPVWSSKTYIRE